MYSDRHGPRPSEQDRSEAVTGNVPWTDLYTDDVLARMRAQRLLSAKVKELRSLADSEFIGSAIDTTSNSVTVYWHGPRPAAVNTVVRQALASGITVNTVAAPFTGTSRISRKAAVEASLACSSGHFGVVTGTGAAQRANDQEALTSDVFFV